MFLIPSSIYSVVWIIEYFRGHDQVSPSFVSPLKLLLLTGMRRAYPRVHSQTVPQPRYLPSSRYLRRQPLCANARGRQTSVLLTNHQEGGTLVRLLGGIRYDSWVDPAQMLWMEMVETIMKSFLSATEFTIPWRTIIRHGGCRVCVCLSVCLSVCPGANFARG